MIVVHPFDSTTEFLKQIYKDTGAKVLDQNFSNAQISKALYHCPMREPIVLLGHGSDAGLFSRCKGDATGEYDRKIVNHSHGYLLRRHCGNIIGIWCHADRFAQKERLHGLFSGMIVSELDEAKEYGIVTSQEELDRENDNLATRLRYLLDHKVPLCAIPQKMMELDNARTPLTLFNYHNLFYL